MIDFKSKRKKLADLKNSGLSVVEIAKRYKISRQAVYQLLKKAVRDGNEVKYHNIEKRFNICQICGDKFYGSTKNTKTCKPECKKSFLLQKSIDKNGKWSKSIFIEYICCICNKEFKRSRYMDSISKVKSNNENKKYYCGKQCYYNRNLT